MRQEVDSRDEVMGGKMTDWWFLVICHRCKLKAKNKHGTLYFRNNPSIVLMSKYLTLHYLCHLLFRRCENCEITDTQMVLQYKSIWRLRFSSDADNVRLTNVCIIIIIIIIIIKCPLAHVSLSTELCENWCSSFWIILLKKTNKQTDKQTDRETDKQTDRQTN